jgi:hypothetical protein
LGALLRRERVKAGLSARGLAEAAAVSASTVSPSRLPLGSDRDQGLGAADDRWGR